MDTDSFDWYNCSRDAFKTSISRRGGIIAFAINIENRLTDILAWCFYPTETKWPLDIPSHLDKNGIVLKSTLLRRLEFSDKIDILKTVITARNLLPMTQDNKNLIKEIIKNLNDIRRFRNLLAHSPLDLSPDSLKSLTHNIPSQGTDDFELIEYNRGKAITHRIDRPRIKSEVLRMWKSNNQLDYLFALLKSDTKHAQFARFLLENSERDINYILRNLQLND